MNMVSSQILLVLLLYRVSGQTCSKGVYYDIVENFKTDSSNLATSFLNISAPLQMICGTECSNRNSCVVAVFDKNEKTCLLFNHTIDGEAHGKSPYCLMIVKKDDCYNRRTSTVNYGSPITRNFTDCQEAFESGHRKNGVYTLNPGNRTGTIQAMCHFDSAGWTVFQARLNGSVDFTQGWIEYAKGFGSASHEYWLGLDNLNLLTRSNRKLSVYLQAHDGEIRTANYSSFQVEDSSLFYTLRVSGYSGSAGDSLTYHNGMKFSTINVDNDIWYRFCAGDYLGGWWYRYCTDSSLNGIWHNGGFYSTTYWSGAHWSSWKGFGYTCKTLYMRVSR